MNPMITPTFRYQGGFILKSQDIESTFVFSSRFWDSRTNLYLPGRNEVNTTLSSVENSDHLSDNPSSL